MRTVVVLPAPFGPRKAVTTPGRTVALRSSTAHVGPNRLVRPSKTSVEAASVRRSMSSRLPVNLQQAGADADEHEHPDADRDPPGDHGPEDGREQDDGHVDAQRQHDPP